MWIATDELALGFFGIEIGTMLLVLAFMNRAVGRTRNALEWLLLYVGGTAICESFLVKIEYSSRSDQHNALFYAVAMIGMPVWARYERTVVRARPRPASRTSYALRSTSRSSSIGLSPTAAANSVKMARSVRR